MLAPDNALVIEVVGRPATFATAHEQPWKAALREAIAVAGIVPQVARWAVRVEFRTPPSRHSGEKWDLDNLVKPTLDAMEGVFGLREWRGLPQPADDTVDYIEASKHTVKDGEQVGATIVVWVLD